ncbi:Ferripyoverdine receptor precursor [Bordetella ansorpii]|uniref:Ferripyoverdine receptor n=1 Tax=Bordetella ansorpii TaxID=288768 RepID=A0A157RMP8_9BORD|nr:STN domain-containing protein [Bordetella ansorpii]SAI59146.1 Ferripyoverdine receptor precursor [Bordetella ansorpii]
MRVLRVRMAALIAVAGMGAACLAPPSACASQALAEVPARPDPVSSDTQAFDLPAAPLHETLQRFGLLTGLSVLYEAGLVAQRRSAPVRGSMSADTALRRLLAGSGVRVGYATGQVYTLLPEPAASKPKPDPVLTDADRQRYYARLQGHVLRALCADPLLHTGSYRVALRFRIDGRPAIDRLLVAATTRPEMEPRIAAALAGLPVLAPPPGLAQPITMLLASGAGGTQRACAGTP